MSNDNGDSAKDKFDSFTDKAKDKFTEATGKLTGDKEREARGKAGQVRNDIQDAGNKAKEKLGDVADSVKGTVAGLRGNKPDDEAPGSQD